MSTPLTVILLLGAGAKGISSSLYLGIAPTYPPNFISMSQIPYLKHIGCSFCELGQVSFCSSDLYILISCF